MDISKPVKPNAFLSENPATQIPNDPDALLTRKGTAEALTAKGFQIAPKTLSTKASRGGGPPYRIFNARAIYRWGDSLDWAHAHLSPPRGNTSARDVE